MSIEQFRSKLATFLWNNGFDHTLSLLGFKPNYEDRYQVELWETIQQLQRSLAKFDKEMLEKLIKAIE